ncbi:DUF4126 family protein [Edaphobacter bradus]|uniref:DUF4126 family protein n=1 Tax=Edaphobacter bradus TaxID=2259016 RepID=UPI0021DF4B78|nr:DUF4126 family protein [Edaphobacter bradus]
MAVLSWLMAIPLLGFVTGLRPMTPIMVLCWFAYRGDLPLDDSWASWAAKLWVAIVFTLLAVGEYIGDKLPTMPDRTMSAALAVRLFFGGLIGAIVATGLNGAGFEGVILGVLTALAGTFCGFYARKDIVVKNRIADWKVGLVEDVIAVLCAVLAMGVVTG